MNKIEGFTPISDHLVNEFGLIAAAVYGKIWRYWDHFGKCSASNARIAQELGIGEATVKRKAKLLEESGYIEKLRPGKNLGTTNVWIPTGKIAYKTIVVEQILDQGDLPLDQGDPILDQGDLQRKKERNKKKKDRKKEPPILSSSFASLYLEITGTSIRENEQNNAHNWMSALADKELLSPDYLRPFFYKWAADYKPDHPGWLQRALKVSQADCLEEALDEDLIVGA